MIIILIVLCSTLFSISGCICATSNTPKPDQVLSGTLHKSVAVLPLEIKVNPETITKKEDNILPSVDLAYVIEPPIVYTSSSGTNAKVHKTKSVVDSVVKKETSAVEAGLNDYVMGSWLYKVPKIMHRGTPELVTVQLCSGVLKVYSSTSTKIEVQEIKIYPFMSVMLLGEPQFTIKSLSTIDQPVTSDTTTWNFQVTPNNSGLQKLIIRITARIKLSHSEEYKDLPLITKDVYVKVEWASQIKDWLTKNWQYIISLLAGSGLLSWIWTKINNAK